MVTYLHHMFYTLSNNSQIFNNVTMPANEYKKIILILLLAYLPMTRLEDVKPTCKKTVKGSCTDRNICEMISPLKGSPIKNIIKRAKPNDKTIPKIECVSFALYDSPNKPEKILPAAIPLVIVLEIPANNKAIAKIFAALLPNRGCNMACA